MDVTGIWSTMWNRTDELGSSHDLILGDILIGRDVIWCCLDQMNSYLNSIVCDRKHSRPIWSIIWISTDDIWCCLDQIYVAMGIGKNVRGSFHDQLEVLCGLEQMIEDDVFK
jgi:hypothetical protein